MNPETIDAMLAAGASAEIIAAAWKSELIAQGKVTERRRTMDRERQQRRRSRGVTRTKCDPPNDNILTPVVTPTSNDVGPKPVTKSRGSRLAADWVLPDEWRQWGKDRRNWSDKDVSEEAEIFANYWQAKSGTGACHTDWFKTWRNWVIRSHRPDGKGDGKVSTAEQIKNLRLAIDLYDKMGRREEAQEARQKIAALEQAA